MKTFHFSLQGDFKVPPFDLDPEQQREYNQINRRHRRFEVGKCITILLLPYVIAGSICVISPHLPSTMVPKLTQPKSLEAVPPKQEEQEKENMWQIAMCFGVATVFESMILANGLIRNTKDQLACYPLLSQEEQETAAETYQLKLKK